MKPARSVIHILFKPNPCDHAAFTAFAEKEPAGRDLRGSVPGDRRLARLIAGAERRDVAPPRESRKNRRRWLQGVRIRERFAKADEERPRLARACCERI